MEAVSDKIRRFLTVSDGSGSGWGYGWGYGSGYGSGSGWGDGSGVISFCGRAVHMIDGVATIIKTVFGNYARCDILNSDLTLTPCYVAKSGNYFAHGDTLENAVRSLNNKLFDDMDEDDRIAAFWDCHEPDVKYPAMDFFDWHHKLTGSCEFGRNAFAKDHGIDLDADQYTVEEFVELTKDSYGGEIIMKIMEVSE